jgi:hypothetical protein
MRVTCTIEVFDAFDREGSAISVDEKLVVKNAIINGNRVRLEFNGTHFDVEAWEFKKAIDNALNSGKH